MTPEKLAAIRRRANEWDVSKVFADRITLLAHIDAQGREIVLLRRGQGGAPPATGPGSGAFHQTHPIPDSTQPGN